MSGTMDGPLAHRLTSLLFNSFHNLTGGVERMGAGNEARDGGGDAEGSENDAWSATGDGSGDAARGRPGSVAGVETGGARGMGPGPWARDRPEDGIPGMYAILYSGGIDSTVMAMIGKMTLGRERFMLHTFGFPGSRDLMNAREAAYFIDLPWTEHILTEDMVLEAAISLLSLIPDLTFIELSFELPLYLGARTVREETIITGQGADELFGGYAKYREVDDPFARMAMMDRDRHRLFNRTRGIESTIAGHFGKSLITPFLDHPIVRFVSSLGPDDLMNRSGGNKLVLREAGRILGLPELICSRPKIAAQYGSGISRALHTLRKRGMLNPGK